MKLNEKARAIQREARAFSSPVRPAWEAAYASVSPFTLCRSTKVIFAPETGI